MKIIFNQIPIFVALFVLIGCSGLQWPPDRQEGEKHRRVSKSFNNKVPIIRRVALPASGVIQVKRGDTLFIISRRYGISARAIIEANDLLPPYFLQPGESLILPKPRIHTILRGDSLYKISRLYGVDTYELARLNFLRPPYRIFVGNKLKLPPSANQEFPDQVLEIKKSPGKQNGSSVIIKKSRGVDKVRKPTIKQKPKTSKIRSAEPKSKQKSIKTVPVPRIKTSGRFNWPVRGQLLSVYGSKGEGLHNDGINIIAQRGASVRAAGPGIVVYAGNELRGFGNLLLIKHPGGWVTAYAHNDKLLVKRGEKIRRGQIVAKVGTSGNVNHPQLHFEIRRGKRAINPLRHLKRITAFNINQFNRKL